MTSAPEPRPSTIVQAQGSQGEDLLSPPAPESAQRYASTNPDRPSLVAEADPASESASTADSTGSGPAAPSEPEGAVLSGTEHHRIFWETFSASALGKVAGALLMKVLDKLPF